MCIMPWVIIFSEGKNYSGSNYVNIYSGQKEVVRMQSEGQLIRRIRLKRDREAAGELFDRYYKRIYAYTYRQTGDRELAMDLTQDIFIAILQGIGSFDERKAQFGTWAFRVASNKITDYYRSRAHREKLLETVLPAQEGGDGGSLFPEEGVLKALLDREAIRGVMEIVTRFDAEWVRIFQKKCFGECTFAEIAEETGLSEGTVKTRFYKMLRKVREETGL